MKSFIKKNYAIFVFALIFFVVGSENGGYQIALINITSDLQLNETVKGIIVAMQYLAILVTPLIFGNFADKFGKKKIAIIFLFILFIGCLIITYAYNVPIFIVGIFFVGAGISIIQTIISAQLIDIYPASNPQRMTIAQIFYSLGAVISPLAFNSFMNKGMSWHYVFTAIGIMCIIGIVGYLFLKNKPQEFVYKNKDHSNSSQGKMNKESNIPWLYVTIFIIIFLVYVGVETGFAYFLPSFMKGELNAEALSAGCLSLFWGMQIAGRVISVALMKIKHLLLLICLVGMSISIILIGTSTNSTSTYIFTAFAGLFCGPIYPLITSIGISFAPQKSATVSGFFIASSGVGGMLLPIVVGSLGGYFNYQVSFYFLGCFVIVGIIAYLIYLFKSHSLVKVHR